MVVFGFSCVQSVRSLSLLAGGLSFTGMQGDHNDSPFTEPVFQMSSQRVKFGRLPFFFVFLNQSAVSGIMILYAMHAAECLVLIGQNVHH